MSSGDSTDLNTLFTASIRKLQHGDIQGALGGLQQVADRAPDNPTVLHHLAICNMHLGKFRAARILYKKLHDTNTGNPETLTNLAICHKEEKQLIKATEVVNRALELDPEHLRATNLLGTVQALQGNLENAVACFRKSLERDEGDAETRINLASVLFQCADYDGAHSVLEPLLGSEAPVETLQLAGQIYLHQKNRSALADVIEKLMKLAPSDVDTIRLELFQSELEKDHDAVILIARRLLDRNQHDDTVLHALGQALFLSGRVEESLPQLEKVIELAPEVARYRNSIGLVFAAQGDRPRAEARFREAIALNPEYGEAYRSLSALKTFYEPNDLDISLFESAWNNNDISRGARCKIGFALGKAYDDCGDFARAATVYKAANELAANNSRNPVSDEIAAAHIRQFRRIIDVCSDPPDYRQRVTQSAAPRPIFILGMPRSGTTLVEQILSRSPDVTACGELSFIERGADSMISAPQRFPADLGRVNASGFDAQARAYIEKVTTGQNVNTAAFTDKMPLNFRYIWIICAMFPNAGIIHCKRHPLDVVLSNFFQLYGATAMGFSYDLTALAHYYAAYRRLMLHWTQILAERIHIVQYEALVAENRAVTQALVEALNLEWHDRFLHHEQSGATVRTASIWQVRKQLYSTSIGRWQNYRALLEPAIGVLQEEGVLDDQLQEIHG